MSKTRNTDNQFAFDLDGAIDADKTPPTSPSQDTRLALDQTENVLELLDSWQQAGWIRPLDVRFARLIQDLSEEQGEAPQPLVLLLAALTSHQVGRGHVCVDLATLLADADNTLSLPPEEPSGALPTHNTFNQAAASVEQEEAGDGRNGAGELQSRGAGQECMIARDEAFAVSDGSHTASLVLSGTRLDLR